MNFRTTSFKNTFGAFASRYEVYEHRERHGNNSTTFPTVQKERTCNNPLRERTHSRRSVSNCTLCASPCLPTRSCPHSTSPASTSLRGLETKPRTMFRHQPQRRDTPRSHHVFGSTEAAPYWPGLPGNRRIHGKSNADARRPLPLDGAGGAVRALHRYHRRRSSYRVRCLVQVPVVRWVRWWCYRRQGAV